MKHPGGMACWWGRTTHPDRQIPFHCDAHVEIGSLLALPAPIFSARRTQCDTTFPGKHRHLALGLQSSNWQARVETAVTMYELRVEGSRRQWCSPTAERLNGLVSPAAAAAISNTVVRYGHEMDRASSNLMARTITSSIRRNGCVAREVRRRR